MTFKEFMDDYFDNAWNDERTPYGDYRDQQAHDMHHAYEAGAHDEAGFLEGWLCPICHVAYPPWVTECKCSKDIGYYTTTQNVLTRFANKGPLPPPVVDFSTDQCPACGEVLNQCTCPQVLQRVDFNEELAAENKRLKELLRDVALSGVEFDDERIGYVTVQIDRTTWNELVEMRDKGEERK